MKEKVNTWGLILAVLSICFQVSISMAQISPISNGSWQQSGIWPGSQVPGTSDEVLIPVGMTVDLAGNIVVKSITINGTLRALPGTSVEIEAEWIMVMGSQALLEIGTPSVPFDAAETCKITLTGNKDQDDVMGMGDKFIGAMNGGRIDLHGHPKVSWSHLGQTALPGTNTITMSEPVDWEPGDKIVIVSSRPNWEEAEQKIITAISSDSVSITLDSPLAYPHFGMMTTYTRGTDNKTWTADLRAEVGLLSHNVTIQGDAGSAINGYGGHLMCMPNSTMNASSIELYRMGQKGELGRYPWHWHHVHLFGTGQYFNGSSVHNSYNRGITIHATSHVTVDNNFFYDHIGHGVFLEDGSERFNTISNNVVLLTKRPLPGEEVTPSDNELNEVQNRTPSSFWITNPNNYFEGNVAAGTHGTGFWFALPQSPMGSSANDPTYSGIEPFKEPLGMFRGNKAHSCMSGFDIFDQLNPDHSIRPNAGWQNSDLHLIENCTWYSNSLAVYSGIGATSGNKVDYTSNLIFLDNVFVENIINVQFASYSQVQQSVFVALGVLPLSSLYRIYDGAGQIRDCHLVGWNNPSTDYLRDGGAGIKHTNHRISGITTDDGLPPIVNLRDYDIPISNTDFTPQSLSHPRVWNVVLYDEDGSFSGAPNSSIVSNHPMMLVGDEYQPSNWVHAYRSPHKFVLTLLSFPGMPRDNYPNATCTRIKSGSPTESVYDVYGYKDHLQLPAIVNEGFLYSYQFESLPPTKSLNVQMDDAEAGDTYLIRFKDFGKLGGLNILSPTGGIPEYFSLAELNNSSQTAFFTEPTGSVYLKFVATQLLQRVQFNWTTDFTVPVLDTDGDGISDRQEIINGTNPFDQVLSIFEPEAIQLNLFPNPVSSGEDVSLSLPPGIPGEDLRLRLLTPLGQTVVRYQIPSPREQIHFSTAHLPAGLYLVAIESPDWRGRSKLIVR